MGSTGRNVCAMFAELGGLEFCRASGYGPLTCEPEILDIAKNSPRLQQLAKQTAPSSKGGEGVTSPALPPLPTSIHHSEIISQCHHLKTLSPSTRRPEDFTRPSTR